jgi:hypothetical protein
MTHKMQQKTGQNGRMKINNVYSKVNNAYMKISRADLTVNKANAQSRLSGILCALAHGKLYFGATGMFPSHQNHLPRKGEDCTPKSHIHSKSIHI